MSNALAVHTRRWAVAFAERGHDIHVLSIRHDEIPGVKVHTVCVGPVNSKSVVWTFLSYLRLALTARRRLKALAPDVLNAHYVVTHGVIAACSAFHPQVVSCWGRDVIWDNPGKMPWYLRILNRLALRKADLVCSTSRFMVGPVREFAPPGARIEQVPFGVDCDRFRPADASQHGRNDGEFRVGFVKTLLPKYGPEVLVRAMAQILDAVPNARLIMAGRGPMRQELRELARDLAIEKRVEFAGFVPHDEVPRLMQSLDVVVNCSVCPESFGVVILEASACQVPVVVTCVGGVPEVCIDGQTGIMVSPNDSGALAAAITRLAKDPALREKMGSAGREFVLRRYVWRDNVTRMLQHLEQLSGHR